VTAAELATVYHTVEHNLSYSSMDCGVKLMQKIFNDSSIGKKLSCGRTKAESLVKNVLAPKAVSQVLLALSGDGKPLPFAIQTDASNKGNCKMFPIAVQFFTPQNGLLNKNPDESANGIVKCITNSLENVGLSLDNVSAFSADNTNVNCGVHNSVYTDLHKKHENLLQGNCCAHIVHNAVRHALNKLSVDIETVVLKVYGFFSVSAKRRENLKEFFVFLDVQWRKILQHVTTRWLSLNPAISRMLQNWAAIKSYFISIGDDCPKQIQKVLKLAKYADTVEDDDLQDTVEVYLLFCNNNLNIEEAIKKLERNDTTAPELYRSMKCLKDKLNQRKEDEYYKLNQRKEDEYYGYLTKQKMTGLSPMEADTAKKEFKEFLNCAIVYLDKWFNFSEPLSLHTASQISYTDMENVVQRLNLIKWLQLHMDNMYDEFPAFKQILHELEKAEDWKQSTPLKWKTVFEATDTLPNMLSVLSFVLSIPATIGYVEHIFSHMQNKWYDNCNRCSTELIKSELLVSLNFDLSCANFHTMVLKDRALL
uniref:HAT C-terminal dimerisation domain-containing protein n=1 Tax=Latimeria chalumnae TaxID=7897 RepID=H3AK16_LATCH